MATRTIKNQDVAFSLLQRDLDHVATEQERRALLEQLIALEPRGDRALRERARYKSELETLKRKSGARGAASDNPYDGLVHDRQVVIVGDANTGKSTLIRLLTGCEPAISAAPFTTYQPEAGMHVVRDVPVQVVEVPAVYPGEDNPRKYQFIRNAGVVCIAARDEADARSALSTIEERGVLVVGEGVPRSEHQYRPRDEILRKPGFITAWSLFSHALPVAPAGDAAVVGEIIYRLLGIMRIYSVQGNAVDGRPCVFPAGDVTVREFALALDKRYAQRFHKAEITGASADFDGQVVGMDHRLRDGDRVRLIA